DGAEEERARYWRARALLEPDPSDTEAGRAAAREAARADLIWLVEERPLTYHGLLARGRLAELDPDRARAIDEAETKDVASGLRERGPLHAGPIRSPSASRSPRRRRSRRCRRTFSRRSCARRAPSIRARCPRPERWVSPR